MRLSRLSGGALHGPQVLNMPFFSSLAVATAPSYINSTYQSEG